MKRTSIFSKTNYSSCILVYLCRQNDVLIFSVIAILTCSVCPTWLLQQDSSSGRRGSRLAASLARSTLSDSLPYAMPWYGMRVPAKEQTNVMTTAPIVASCSKDPANDCAQDWLAGCGCCGLTDSCSLGSNQVTSMRCRLMRLVQVKMQPCNYKFETTS